MPQKTKQDRTLKKLNEMEANKLLDTDFKTIFIRMLKELGDNFSKETATIKRTEP